MANAQEVFWKGNFGSGYIGRNQKFDKKIAVKAWKAMLQRATGVRSILECGSNIGRNLEILKTVAPASKLSLIEINEDAYKKAVASVRPAQSFNGPILASKFKHHSFDLVFTSGVLIHIAPGELKRNCQKIFDYSRKYVLVSEYFNRTPVSIDYHGIPDKLFKRDFGKFMLENFPLEVVDYGFLWSGEYEAGGFDDMTWWLFRKR